MKRLNPLASALLLSVIAFSPCAARQVVWSIGEVDQDYADLAAPGNDFLQRFAPHPTFVVGQDDPKEKFSAMHPGPIDRWAGSHPHTFTIQFDVPEKPQGEYLLSIDLVDSHNSSPPIMEVSLNGKTTQKRLAYGTGDPTLMSASRGKPQRLRLRLDASDLRPAGNILKITGRNGSYLIYDAISLAKLEEGSQVDIDLKSEPTVFFVERDGELLQELTFFADGINPRDDVRLMATAGGETLLEIERLPAVMGVCSEPIHVPPTSTKREIEIALDTGDQHTSARMTQYPEKRWRIYVAPSTHTDIGYTDIQSNVIDLHNRNTDLALELIDEFPLYHWNLESSWAAQMWLRDNPPQEHPRLYSAAQRKRLGIESSYLNMLTGLCSGEELIRNLYYSARLLRDHDVPFKSHTLTDAPSHVWTVPTVLKQCGINYLSVGVNQTRAPLFRHDLHRKSPFWWEGPDGSRVLTWMTTGYSQAGWIGLKEGPKQMRESVERTLWRWRLMEDYPYDAVLLHGAYTDNVAIGRDIAESITAYADRYAYPKVILGANDDFFRHIEEHFLDKVPTLRGGGGSWWEDGAASSARETAMNRVAHEDTIAAETAWAIASVGTEAEVPREEFQTLWDNILLFDEHTWGAHNSIRDPDSDFVRRQFAVKAGYAEQASDASRRLLERGLRHIASKVDVPEGSLLVFNPSGRGRGGVIRADIPKGSVIVNANGRSIPQQVEHAEALDRMRVLAVVKDIPPVGYATYRVVENNPGQSVTPARFDASRNVLENDHYRITFDVEQAAISSLVDKHTGRELVDAAGPYRFGQMVYAAGGEEHEGQTQVMCPDPAKVEYSQPTHGGIKLHKAGPVSTIVHLPCKHPMFHAFRLEIHLYEHEPRVDFVYDFDKKLTYVKEAVYFAFPVAGSDPQLRYAVGAGSVRPNEDHLPGACRDWFSVQRWVTVNSDGLGVAWSPVDTPLISLCDMNAGKWLDTLDITNGTIFAYAMNNYWFTNYKAGQDRRHRFVYALTSGDRMDERKASLFGEEVCAPLRVITTHRTTPAEPTWPPRQSFIRVEPDNVMVSTLKPAEDGQGTILRLREFAGRRTDVRVELNLPHTPRSAYRCDLVERVQDELGIDGGKLSLKIPARSMATVRLK